MAALGLPTALKNHTADMNGDNYYTIASDPAKRAAESLTLDEHDETSSKRARFSGNGEAVAAAHARMQPLHQRPEAPAQNRRPEARGRHSRWRRRGV